MYDNKKAGVSMGGSLEYTRSKKTKSFISRKNTVKKQLAKICVGCENNNDSWCKKYNGWCSKVNFHCNGLEMNYDEQLIREREEYQKRKKEKEQQQLERKQQEKKKKKKKKQKQKKQQQQKQKE